MSVVALLDCTNQYRSEQNLPDFQLNPSLSKAAFKKLEDIEKYDYWAHANPSTGKKPWNFLDDIGYSYLHSGENLAFNHSTAQEVCSSWVQSDAHRKNLVDKDFQEVGFALKEVTLSEYGTGILVVQLFATPENSEPHPLIDTPQTQLNCLPMISDAIRIISPPCEVVNTSQINIKVELLDITPAEIQIFLDNNRIELQAIELNNIPFLTHNTSLEEGQHIIKVITQKTQHEAIVEFFVDTTPPTFQEDKLFIHSHTIHNEESLHFEIPVIDETLNNVEIHYSNKYNQPIQKDLQLLGDQIYYGEIHGNNAFNIQSPKTIKAFDKAGNSSSFILPQDKIENAISFSFLSYLSGKNFWKYFAFFLLTFALILYIIEIIQRKTHTINRESRQQKIIQAGIIILLLLAILLNYI